MDTICPPVVKTSLQLASVQQCWTRQAVMIMMYQKDKCQPAESYFFFPKVVSEKFL